MTVIYDDESGRELPFEPLPLAEKVIEAALDYEECPYEAEVNLLLTDDEGIQRINKEMRDIDRATDVLSFPMLEYGEAGDFRFLEEDASAFHPETGELVFGDVVISVDKVYAQAEEYGHSLQREFAFLLVHSMLHLCGYDHMEPEEAKVMEHRQEEILQELGITRE